MLRKKISFNKNIFRQFSSLVENNSLKVTSLNLLHKSMNAKRGNIANYDMPIFFEGIINEHLHCRKNCSIFDISHMGQLRVHGSDRQEFIESLVVSDMKEQKIGSSILTLMTNENAGIIDSPIVTNLQEFSNLVLNSTCVEKDMNYIINELETKWNKKDIRLELLQNSALIAIQGPKAYKALQPITAANLNNLYYMEAVFIEIPYINETVLVTRTGFTGEDGFEISISDKNALKFVELLLSQKEINNSESENFVKMSGLGAQDTLRLEAGIYHYGRDLSESITPIEASLKCLLGKRRLIEKNFYGCEIILKQLNEGTKNKIVGFVADDGPPVREGSLLYSDEERQNLVGKVTSGSYSPIIRKPIGIAYVNSQIESTLKVFIRDKEHDLKIQNMPFIKTNYYKKKG